MVYSFAVTSLECNNSGRLPRERIQALRVVPAYTLAVAAQNRHRDYRQEGKPFEVLLPVIPTQRKAKRGSRRAVRAARMENRRAAYR